MRIKLIFAGLLMAVLLTPTSVYGLGNSSYIAGAGDTSGQPLFCDILNLPIIRLETVLGSSGGEEATPPASADDTPTSPPISPNINEEPPPDTDDEPQLPTIPPDIDDIPTLPPIPPNIDDIPTLPPIPPDIDDEPQLPTIPPDIDDMPLLPPPQAGVEQNLSGELPTVFMTTSALNLRSSPCTSETRIALVPVGARVEVTDFLCGEWFAVIHNGIRGYMYAEFLMEPPVPAAPGTIELLDWSVVRDIITLGTPITIIDVRTGLSYQIASFSNGRHADVEPLTAEDTAIMFQTFGGRWSWETRPVIAIINGRTIAASINGMPHAGSTRDNNMNGHVCLHFLGSRTHNGTASHERSHQASIQEAFNTASNW